MKTPSLAFLLQSMQEKFIFFFFMKRHKKILCLLAIGAVFGLASILLDMANIFEQFEAKSWDCRVRLLAKPSVATQKIKIIFIDQQSIDWVLKEQGYSWPWPRTLYQPIINYCKRAGVKALAFDMLYTEPSVYGIEDDSTFANAISNMGACISTIFLGKKAGATLSWQAEIKRNSIKRTRELEELLFQPILTKLIQPSAIFPIKDVANASALLGNVEGKADEDGIYRRLPPFAIFDKEIVPSLAFAAFLLGNKSSNSLPAISINNNSLICKQTKIPLDKEGRAILRFRGPSQTYKSFSAAAIIQSELKLQEGSSNSTINVETLKDSYVFVGGSAPGLLDNRPAPVGKAYAGVEIHATMLDNLLSNDFFYELSKTSSSLLYLLLALAGSLLAGSCKNALQTATTLIIILALPVAVCLASYSCGVWVPLVASCFAAFSGSIGAILFNYSTEGRQKRFIKNAFKQYISGDVITQLLENPELLTLGGEEKELSIHFSDLQGFSTISEALSPTQLTALLNEFLSEMTDIIQEEGGTLDKYIGDAIVAFWNAPLTQPDHPLRSVRAALRCQSRLLELRPILHNKYGKNLFSRIGINTGKVVVGNMGSLKRFNYTMLGDAANLASRLEGINKYFGIYTLISENTFLAIKNTFPAREIGKVCVVGKTQSIRIYEPMTEPDYTSKKNTIETFRKALQAFYAADFEQAYKLFASIKEMDAPATAYLKRCEQLLKEKIDISLWNGVWKMTEK
jgi:adenylate cyclase